MTSYKILLLATATCAWSAPASAHATLETKEAAVGGSYKAIVKIGHGCEGTATLKVRVQIPEGVIAVKPMPKAGWTLETTTGAYAKPYKYHRRELSEGVKEIVWTGKLLDEHYDEFVFASYLTDGLAAGSTVYFPTTQECEKGAHRWIEIPAPGQDAHTLKSPAPGLRLVAAATKSAATPSYKVGALVLEAPWIRATPGGAKVAGGYVKISNTGTEPDHLMGGTFPLAEVVEVHEMGMTDGVMKMRSVPKGLEIKPGGSVDLKPGGYHLMFQKLKSPLKEGQTIKGTLVFEKAGSIEVEYKVTPIGSSSGSAAGGGHSHH
jgi:uncharacterized protein YcnI/copper(I)-binding protein